MDGPPRKKEKGHFRHAQGLRTHVMPVQVLVALVQGMAAGRPPFEKFDRVEIVFL